VLKGERVSRTRVAELLNQLFFVDLDGALHWRQTWTLQIGGCDLPFVLNFRHR
jgi:hypothetical protein